MRRLCRILFSRYTICALVIAVDIALMSYILFYSVYLYFWIFGIAVLCDAAVVLSLINREANPEFKVSWLVVVLVMPLFGALLYLLFYSRRMSRRDSARMERITERISVYMKTEESDNALSSLAQKSRGLAGQVYSLLDSDPLSSAYRGSDFRYFSDQRELYGAMLRAIEEAERYIYLEYFIVEDGAMWRGIYDRLLEKVKSGVEVRMLYDDIGCMSTLPWDFDLKLRREGISCYRFSRVTPKVTSVHNNRDHRKILVVDGCIAFTGGVNIADEYINLKQPYGHWKDGGAVVCGEAALGFTALFLSLYDFTTGKESDYEALLGEGARSEISASCARLRGAERNPLLPYENKSASAGCLIPFGTGPKPAYKNQVGKLAIINALYSAVDYVYITTPYLIIDYELTEALRMAAQRGVDVRIITPGVADKRIVKIMTKGSYETLIKAGVRIFEYAKGFIHEKLLVVDGELAVIGTINLDYRSLVHHFECALFACESKEISRVREGFMATLRDSVEITEKTAALSFIERCVRYTVRIFAPLM